MHVHACTLARCPLTCSPLPECVYRLALYCRYGSKALYLEATQIEHYEHVTPDGLVATALEHWWVGGFMGAARYCTVVQAGLTLWQGQWHRGGRTACVRSAAPPPLPHTPTCNHPSTLYGSAGRQPAVASHAFICSAQVRQLTRGAATGWHPLSLSLLSNRYFSRAQHHVITLHSGMGRTAAFMSLRPGPSVFSVDHATGRRLYERGCRLADADRPMDVYSSWSGV